MRQEMPDCDPLGEIEAASKTLMALLSGALWYFQFFFYGIGHAYLGTEYGFSSWALHMAILILFSNLYGFLFREWEGASRRPVRVLQGGMACIVVATLIITYGNYLGETTKDKAASEGDVVACTTFLPPEIPVIMPEQT